jgi:hypothetical protein
MDQLLAQNFTLVATVNGLGEDRFLVYRRKES